MLNRRILRIKVFKEIYAVRMGSTSSLSRACAQLDEALESTRDLYLFMMAFIPALTAVAADRLKQLELKVNKSEQERNPNRRFADNSLAALLNSDPDFAKILKKKKLVWGAYDLILRKIYASVAEKDYFLEYMQAPKSSLKDDCRLFTRIFEEEIVDREDLETALEEGSIYWNDDLAYASPAAARPSRTSPPAVPGGSRTCI